MLSTISNNLLSSIKQNSRQLQQNAGQISKLNLPSDGQQKNANLSRLMAEQRDIKTNSKISIKAFQISNEALGFLLNTEA